MLSRCHSLCGGAGPFWQFVPRKGVARHWHEYHGGSVECWQVPPFLHGYEVHPSSSHVAPLHPASPLQMHGSSELAGQVPPWPHVFDPQLAFPAEPSAESQRWADTKANASNARREHRIGPTNTDTRYRVPRRPKWGRLLALHAGHRGAVLGEGTSAFRRADSTTHVHTHANSTEGTAPGARNQTMAKLSTRVLR